LVLKKFSIIFNLNELSRKVLVLGSKQVYKKIIIFSSIHKVFKADLYFCQLIEMK